MQLRSTIPILFVYIVIIISLNVHDQHDNQVDSAA